MCCFVGTADATWSGEVTGKRALCLRVLSLCHLSHLGYICERGVSQKKQKLFLDDLDVFVLLEQLCLYFDG